MDEMIVEVLGQSGVYYKVFYIQFAPSTDFYCIRYNYQLRAS